MEQNGTLVPKSLYYKDLQRRFFAVIQQHTRVDLREKIVVLLNVIKWNNGTNVPSVPICFI
jgi:hypothetical protein